MKVKLSDVRIGFTDLWTAVEFKPGDGKPRFNATFLIEPGSANDKALRAAIKTEAANTYGAKSEAIVKSMETNANKFCYLDGNTKEYDGYENMFYLASHAKVRPLVINRRPKNEDGTPNLVTEESGIIYDGCYVNASVEIYAQKGENQGIRCSLGGVQFNRDGDAFGGGRAAKADEFDDISDGADGDDFS
jgi:hypothetical protein